MSDCFFEIDQLWQSGFSRVYSKCCCSCWFEYEIINLYWIFKSQRYFKCPYEKYLETYRMHLISLFKWFKASLCNTNNSILKSIICLPSRFGLYNTPTAPLWRGKTPPNECPGYDTRQFDGEVPVILELRVMQCTFSFPLLQGPLWPGMVAPDRTLSMG